jgi:hypothetical protein
MPRLDPDKPNKGIAVRAGTSGGHTLCAAAACTALWYTVDDRLAGLLNVPEIGTLQVSMVFVVLLIAGLLVSLAGMRWEG